MRVFEVTTYLVRVTGTDGSETSTSSSTLGRAVEVMLRAVDSGKATRVEILRKGADQVEYVRIHSWNAQVKA